MSDDDPRSLDLVDPELREALRFFPAMPHTPETLPAARASMAEAMAATPQPDVPGVTEREVMVEGPLGPASLRLWIVEPIGGETPRPLLYHMHGGGYMFGTPEMMRASYLPLAAALGITIISVDYRLAPENPHPAPIEDSYAGLIWAHANAAELGVDPGRIAVAGQSAGGGLAAALALLARDRGVVPIRYLMLGSPMIDDRSALSDDHVHVGQFVWTRAQNRAGWESLLGHELGRDDVSPYAVPARAADLSRLPPTFIDTGALDLFLEENLEFARRLTRAGVPVELHVYPGAYHGFGLSSAARVVQQQRQINESALKRALFG